MKNFNVKTRFFSAVLAAFLIFSLLPALSLAAYAETPVTEPEWLETYTISPTYTPLDLKSFISQISAEKPTKLVFQADFSLAGATLEIPEGCTLMFASENFAITITQQAQDNILSISGGALFLKNIKITGGHSADNISGGITAANGAKIYKLDGASITDSASLTVADPAAEQAPADTASAKNSISIHENSFDPAMFSGGTAKNSPKIGAELQVTDSFLADTTPLNGITFALYQIISPPENLVLSDYTINFYNNGSILSLTSKSSPSVNLTVDSYPLKTTGKDDDRGIAHWSELPDGFYIVAEQKDSFVDQVSSAFLVKLPYSSTNTSDSSASAITDVHVYLKTEYEPVIECFAPAEQGVNIGNEVTYTIKITLPPDYSSLDICKLTDIIDNALDIDKASIKIELFTADDTSVAVISDTDVASRVDYTDRVEGENSDSLFPESSDKTIQSTATGSDISNISFVGGINKTASGGEVYKTATGSDIAPPENSAAPAGDVPADNIIPASLAVDLSALSPESFDYLTLSFNAVVNKNILNKADDLSAENAPSIQFDDKTIKADVNTDVHVSGIDIRVIDLGSYSRLSGIVFKLALTKEDTDKKLFLRTDPVTKNIYLPGDEGYDALGLDESGNPTDANDLSATTDDEGLAYIRGIKNYYGQYDPENPDDTVPMKYYILASSLPSGLKEASTLSKGIVMSLDASITFITEAVSPTYELPHTGGTGLVLFTIIGILLIGGAILLMSMTGNKKKKPPYPGAYPVGYAGGYPGGSQGRYPASNNGRAPAGYPAARSPGAYPQQPRPQNTSQGRAPGGAPGNLQGRPPGAQGRPPVSGAPANPQNRPQPGGYRPPGSTGSFSSGGASGSSGGFSPGGRPPGYPPGGGSSGGSQRPPTGYPHY